VAIAELRSAFDWVGDTPGTDIVQDPDGPTWCWTFAGTAANTELMWTLGSLASATPANGLAIRLADGATRTQLADALEERGPMSRTTLPDDLAEAYKFADALPVSAATEMVRVRDRDPLAVRHTVELPVSSHRLNRAAPRP
jgi:hypothetical protein